MAKIYDLGTIWVKRFKDDTCIVVHRAPHDVYVGVIYQSNIYEVGGRLDIYDSAKCRDTYTNLVNRYKHLKREDAYRLVTGNPCDMSMEGDKINDALLGLVTFVNGKLLKTNMEDDVTDED